MQKADKQQTVKQERKQASQQLPATGEAGFKQRLASTHANAAWPRKLFHLCHAEDTPAPVCKFMGRSIKRKGLGGYYCR